MEYAEYLRRHFRREEAKQRERLVRRMSEYAPKTEEEEEVGRARQVNGRILA